MNKVVLIISFIFSLNSATAVENPYINLEEVLDKSLMQETQIVILGDEDHYNQNIKDLFFNLTSKFQEYDRTFNCVFLEHDQRYQDAIDSFFNGVNYNDSIENKKLKLFGSDNYDRLELKSYLRNDYLISLRNKMKVFSYDIAFQGELAEKLNQSYTKIYIEKSPTVEDLRNFKDIGFVLRNDLMAQNIIKLVKDNNCERSLVVTGNGHMMNHLGAPFPEGHIETIADHLSKYGYESQYYNMRSANCEQSNHSICEILESSSFELGSGVVAQKAGIHSGMFITK